MISAAQRTVPILIGLMAFKGMKIQQFPDIDLPTVTVTATLPGAAPAQMETEVARKIENAIASIQGLKNIYTKVQDGGVTITAEFRLEKPTQEAVDDVRDAVRAVDEREGWAAVTVTRIVTLTGIATRNGILKISHYLHLHHEEGEPFGDALILRGARERLTPVLMTAVSAGIALVPLMIFVLLGCP